MPKKVEYGADSAARLREEAQRKGEGRQVPSRMEPSPERGTSLAAVMQEKRREWYESTGRKHNFR